ncbi:MAG: hypothetical protein V7L30_33270 [Nostoc sp.]|uniref:hypothetical protein n=1 Tax=Nostoc sp. TaxID=1180 RepID=UPI002FFC8668
MLKSVSRQSENLAQIQSAAAYFPSTATVFSCFYRRKAEGRGQKAEGIYPNSSCPIAQR